jgi:Transposase
MPHKLNSGIAVIGIDIGKNSFHVVGHDKRGAIVLRRKWSRGQVEARLANLRPCLIGMEACVGAHHLSRKLQMLGHDARLMPAKYVRPYSKGQKNDFRDAEAIAEAVPTAWTPRRQCFSGYLLMNPSRLGIFTLGKVSAFITSFSPIILLSARI